MDPSHCRFLKIQVIIYDRQKYMLSERERKREREKAESVEY